MLQDIQAGRLSPEKGVRRLKFLPYTSLGFARPDHHRLLRQGFPEAIFCEGKTDTQVLAILKNMFPVQSPIIATRMGAKLASKVRIKFPQAKYHALARVLVMRRDSIKPKPVPGCITLLTAGTSDIPVAEEARITAKALGHHVTSFYDIGAAGLHRLLEHLPDLQQAEVIIVVAGMDGILPGLVGGLTGQPVIAVPTSIGYGTGTGGIAALMTMLNACSAGLAVMNIDNGYGAAILAHRILSRLPP